MYVFGLQTICLDISCFLTRFLCPEQFTFFVAHLILRRFAISLSIVSFSLHEI